MGIYLNSGRSLRSARRFGNELRASAAPRLRPATPLRAQMKNEELKMKNHHEYSVSTGRSLRRANRCAIEFVQKSPQPSGGPARADLRDARMQPSARGRRLPVTARPILPARTFTQLAIAGCSAYSGANSAFKITNSECSLRAADPYGIEFAGEHFGHNRLRPAGRSATGSAAKTPQQAPDGRRPRSSNNSSEMKKLPRQKEF